MYREPVCNRSKCFLSHIFLNDIDNLKGCWVNKSLSFPNFVTYRCSKGKINCFILCMLPQRVNNPLLKESTAKCSLSQSTLHKAEWWKSVSKGEQPICLSCRAAPLHRPQHTHTHNYKVSRWQGLALNICKSKRKQSSNYV